MCCLKQISLFIMFLPLVSLIPVINNTYSGIDDSINIIPMKIEDNISSYDTIKLDIKPSQPLPLKPLFFYLEFNRLVNSGSGEILLNVNSTIDTYIGYFDFDNTTINNTGYLELRVHVDSDEIQIDHEVFVVVYRFISNNLTIVAKGFTDPEGDALFYIPVSAVIRVVAIYDSNNDGLYDYLGITSNITIGNPLQPVNVYVYVRKLINYVFNYINPKYSYIQNYTFVPYTHNILLASTIAPPSINYTTRITNVISRDLHLLYPLGGFILLTINSIIHYNVIINNSLVYNGTINIKPSYNSTRSIPPFMTLIPTILINTTTNYSNYLWNTFALSTPDWSYPAYQIFELMVFAFDDDNNYTISITYRINHTKWKHLQLMPPSKIYETLIKAFNNTRQIINDFLENLTLPFNASLSMNKTRASILFKKAYIEACNPGTIVEYNGSISDDLHEVNTPIHIYYVDKPSSQKILIYDPSFRLYHVNQNIIYMMERGERYKQYIYREELTMYNSSKLASIVASTLKLNYHHWEWLASQYDIILASSINYLEEILNSSIPIDAIIISNAFLGLNVEDVKTDIINWDLRDHGLLVKLINKVMHQHIGLILTHGTLADLVVEIYDSASSTNKIKIMSIGHVGSSIDDIDPLSPRCFSSSIGLPLLPLWEELKYKISEAVAFSTQMYPIASLIASTPLQIPYVPWNGTLTSTPETKYIGWDIPNEPIVVPNIYNNSNSYTQIGWQLSMFRAFIYTVMRKVDALKGNITKAYNWTVFELIRKIQNISINNYTSVFYEAFKHGLNTTIESLLNSEVYQENMNIRYVYNNSLKINLTANISSLIKRIGKYMPVKLVAVSPDGLAGIVLYDRYWDNYYYRAVYFSFEPEASVSDSGRKLLIQAINWSINSRKIDLLETLYGILVSNKTKNTYMLINNTINGTLIQLLKSIVFEETTSLLKFNLSIGYYYRVVIVHPWESEINIINISGGEIIDRTIINNITIIDLLAIEDSVSVKLSINSTRIYEPLIISVYESYSIPPPIKETNILIVPIIIFLLTIILSYTRRKIVAKKI